MTKQIKVFNRLWNDEEKALIQTYYGAIRTVSLIDILGRGSIKGINQKFKYYGWTPNQPMYGTVEIMYQGKKHLAKGFTYKKEGNSVKNQVAKTSATYKPRNLTKLKALKPKEAVKREKKDHNPFKQSAVIKPFQVPEGKTLTKVDNKTWKYL
jgi:hypothetical protein